MSDWNDLTSQMNMARELQGAGLKPPRLDQRQYRERLRHLRKIAGLRPASRSSSSEDADVVRRNRTRQAKQQQHACPPKAVVATEDVERAMLIMLEERLPDPKGEMETRKEVLQHELQRAQSRLADHRKTLPLGTRAASPHGAFHQLRPVSTVHRSETVKHLQRSRSSPRPLLLSPPISQPSNKEIALMHECVTLTEELSNLRTLLSVERSRAQMEAKARIHAETMFSGLQLYKDRLVQDMRSSPDMSQRFVDKLPVVPTSASPSRTFSPRLPARLPRRPMHPSSPSMIHAEATRIAQDAIARAQAQALHVGTEFAERGNSNDLRVHTHGVHRPERTVHIGFPPDSMSDASSTSVTPERLTAVTPMQLDLEPSGDIVAAAYSQPGQPSVFNPAYSDAVFERSALDLQRVTNNALRTLEELTQSYRSPDSQSAALNPQASHTPARVHFDTALPDLLSDDYTTRDHWLDGELDTSDVSAHSILEKAMERLSMTAGMFASPEHYFDDAP